MGGFATHFLFKKNGFPKLLRAISFSLNMQDLGVKTTILVKKKYHSLKILNLLYYCKNQQGH